MNIRAKYIITLFTLFSFIFIVRGQTEEIEQELKQELKQETDSVYNSFKYSIDTTSIYINKAKLMLSAGYYYYYKDISKSEYFYSEAKSFLKDKNNIHEANAHSKLGFISRKKGDFDKSFQYFVKAKEIFESIDDPIKLGSTFLDIGSIYRYLGDTEKELAYYKKGYELVKKADGKLVEESHINYDEFYKFQNKENNANIYNDNNKDFEIFRKLKVIGKTHVSLGNFYLRNKQQDSSLYYNNKALKIFKKLKNEKRIYSVYNNLATSYGKKGDHKKDISIRKKILTYAKRENNRMSLCINYHNIASAYSKSKMYPIALSYIDSSLAIANADGLKYRLSKSYKTSASINGRLNRFEDAFNSFIAHKKYADLVFDKKTQNIVKELELQKKFEIEKHKLKLIAHKKATRNRLYIILSLTVLFFSLLLGFFARKNYKIRAKIMRDRLEKQKLRREILDQKFKTSEKEVKQLIADNTMRLEFLKQLSNQIKSDKLKSDNSVVKKYINNLLLKLQQQISTEGKLSSLQKKANALNKEFYDEVGKQFTELTKTEKEVCSLLRLNLSIKEIASIRNVSSDSVKTVRYRIRKKMNVPKEQELEFFIQNLSF